MYLFCFPQAFNSFWCSCVGFLFFLFPSSPPLVPPPPRLLGAPTPSPVCGCPPLLTSQRWRPWVGALPSALTTVSASLHPSHFPGCRHKRIPDSVNWFRPFLFSQESLLSSLGTPPMMTVPLLGLGDLSTVLPVHLTSCLAPSLTPCNCLPRQLISFSHDSSFFGPYL